MKEEMKWGEEDGEWISNFGWRISLGRDTQVPDWADKRFHVFHPDFGQRPIGRGKTLDQAMRIADEIAEFLMERGGPG